MYNFYNIFNSNLILLKYFYYSKTKKRFFMQEIQIVTFHHSLLHIHYSKIKKNNNIFKSKNC